MVEVGATVAIGDLLDERGRETAHTLGDAAPYLLPPLSSGGASLGRP